MCISNLYIHLVNDKQLIMENLKHTKGEWQIVRKDKSNVYLCMTEEARQDALRTYGWYNLHKICLYGDGLNQYPVVMLNEQEALANAKLIAAAPELLEALIEIINTCKPENVEPHKMKFGLDLGEYYVGGCGIPSNKAIHMAINAINKATK